MEIFPKLLFGAPTTKLVGAKRPKNERKMCLFMKI